MRTTRIITALALALGATAAVTGPAAANPPGQVKVGATSALNSADKTVTATCPAGTVVTGGGGYVTNPGEAHWGLVGIDRLEPLNNGTGFVAGMREALPDPASWKLSAVAMCATAPAGYDVVSATGAANATTVSVSCGTKSVIGVGGKINGGNGDVVLDQVQPSADLKTVTARGVPVAGGGVLPPWTVTTYAVCANVTGLSLVSIADPASGDGHKQLLKSCPVGVGLYSAGFTISSGAGAVFLSGLNPFNTQSFSVWADGTDPSWGLTGYGICG